MTVRKPTPPAKPVKRREGGLPIRIQRFFEANPDEELTLSQACTKFDSTPHAVRAAMATLPVQREVIFRLKERS